MSNNFKCTRARASHSQRDRVFTFFPEKYNLKYLNLPNWPSALDPKAHRRPEAMETTVWLFPHATALTLSGFKDLTHDGFKILSLWPSPNCPNSLLPKVNDKITKIKLSEAIDYTDSATKGKVVKDKHVVALMRYYELIKEIWACHI